MKIILDQKVVHELVPESLPMLIHGEEGSGASIYTVALAAKWFEQGYNIVFLCGYEMAEQAFTKIIGHKSDRAVFYTKEHVSAFLAALQDLPMKSVLIVKNVELFEPSIFAALKDKHHVVLSGNVDGALARNILLSRTYSTKVYFSPFPEIQLPALQKYEGFLVSENTRVVTRLIQE